MKKRILVAALAGLMLCPVAAQKRYASPIDFEVLFAGNFGEPRPNHFHCGLDFRTQGVIGKKIYSIADGYISRVTVGMNGFGNAVYVAHDDGNTSVYCHLDRFLPEMQQLIFQKQLQEESEVVDLRLTPDRFPVKAGQLIAISGNTGASTGPHLHLELYRTSDGLLLNPMPYFKHLVQDRIAPKVHGIRIYPYPGEGIVGGKTSPLTFTPTATPKTFRAWGKIGIAFWADDYMNGTHNKFGIYRIRLSVDGKTVYTSQMDSLYSSDHRKINSWGDYEGFIRQKRWYLKGFADPGNDLFLMKTDENRGWININEPRIYRVEYQFTDEFGNTTTTRFQIQGTPYETLLKSFAQEEQEKRVMKNYLFWDRSQVVQEPGMELRIPKGLLFRNVLLKPEIITKPDDEWSHTYRLHSEPVPLRSNATLMLAPMKPLEHPDKCYIESEKGYVGGTYQDGWITAKVRDLHLRYALAVDTVSPTIRPMAPEKWGANRKIRISFKDEDSGLKTVKAYLDGQFVLFTGKQTKVCDLKQHQVVRTATTRELVVTATDRCGNMASDTIRFIY